jgi:G8 domain
MDSEAQALYLCVSASNRQTVYDNLGLRGVYCDETCPKPALGCTREGGDYRLWSDSSNWQFQNSRKLPNETMYGMGAPRKGDDILVPCPWKLKIDQDIELDTLVIDGHVWIDCSKDITIKVRNIWVRGGEFIIGQSGKTCNKVIQLIF